MCKNKVEKKMFDDSKHSKYNTNNPISNFLVTNFYQKINLMLKEINYNSVIDIGCGEGFVFKCLSENLLKKKCYAIDCDLNEIESARKNIPFCNFMQASIYEIPYDDNSFDLVICTEVLEHLENPSKAMEEIFRVCNKYVLLSVPREPIWRLFNLARFSYIFDFGNTPGHLNHWSSKDFIKFVGEKYDLIKISKPLPWTIFLASIKKAV
jgi:ubiquinone/menaquinone biosynthesis C-methylase UbiE